MTNETAAQTLFGTTTSTGYGGGNLNAYPTFALESRRIRWCVIFPDRSTLPIHQSRRDGKLDWPGRCPNQEDRFEVQVTFSDSATTRQVIGIIPE